MNAEPCFFEDFCPIDNTRALIVTGPYYTDLNEIREVTYQKKDGHVIINDATLVKTGEKLRLGNYWCGELLFSSKKIVYTPDGETYPGNQPFISKIGLVCQTGELEKTEIRLNGNTLFDAKSLGKSEIGRPTVYGNMIYYEAREGVWENDPRCWDTYCFDVETKKHELVLKEAANPFVYNGTLFYSSWENGRFTTRYKDDV